MVGVGSTFTHELRRRWWKVWTPSRDGWEVGWSKVLHGDLVVCKWVTDECTEGGGRIGIFGLRGLDR